jgi:hypothetical protein
MSVAVSRLDASCVRKEEEVAVLDAVLSKHDDGKHRCTSPRTTTVHYRWRHNRAQETPPLCPKPRDEILNHLIDNSSKDLLSGRDLPRSVFRCIYFALSWCRDSMIPNRIAVTAPRLSQILSSPHLINYIRNLEICECGVKTLTPLVVVAWSRLSLISFSSYSHRVSTYLGLSHFSPGWPQTHRRRRPITSQIGQPGSGSSRTGDCLHLELEEANSLKDCYLFQKIYAWCNAAGLGPRCRS